jgi:N-acetylneuraminic acid mutarotase
MDYQPLERIYDMPSSPRVLKFYITALAWIAASLVVGMTLLAQPAGAEAIVQARYVLGVDTATPTAGCDLAWRKFPNPNVEAGPSYLSGISAVSRDDAWAVGATLSGTTTLAMHWDGTRWSIFPSPAPGSNIHVGGVTAISPNDAWAVGYYNNSRQLLTMHWNGGAWSAVPNPNPGGNYVTYLHDVDATDSNDVWAVGFYREYAPKGLVMHWSGSGWSVVPSPMDPGINFLSAVDAIAPNDVWVVGFYGPGGSIPYQAFAMHWNGATWTVLSTPTLGSLHNYFSSVVALAPNDVWAVGYTYDGTTTGALAEHWDGCAWSLVATPPGLGSLADVDAAAPDDVWAVGQGATVIHWDGMSWNLVEISGLMPGLGDIDVRTADDIWAAGSTGSPSQPQTWRYSRVCVPEPVTPTPIYEPTATPHMPTATVTSLPATSTPIATPTCQPSGWDALTPYPVEILDHAVAAQGGIIYSFSGVSSATVVPNSYKYNPATNSWVTIAPLPSARQLASAVSDGTYIYILGGSDGYLGGNLTSTLFRYDPATNTYTSLASYDTPTTGQAAAYLDGKIYRIGGCSTVNCSGAISSVEVYDIASNSWAYAASYPISDALLVAVGFNGYVWAAGGGVGETAKAYRYDPGTNSWDDAAMVDLPQSRSSASSGIVNGRWVIAGGYVSGNGGSVIAYDQATNSWSTLPTMPTPGARTSGGSTGSTLYVIGGISPGGGGLGTSYTRAYSDSSCGTPGTTPTQTAVTNTPNPSVTHTATPISTAVSTATVLATPTQCDLTFTDVPLESTFYPFIRCLACRGIISGYDDGTFRPFNDITRGQITKIVSNAASFDEDPGPQIYEDVPEGSTFYAWINRLSMKGHIGGYPCGLLPEEPCVEPDNMPYFRPWSSATRGQLAKIVANAAGLDSTPEGVFYTDAQEDHTFYLWIMRLTELGVMSGYECGGEGEPCDNENRPYFRPVNNVTRGQASKIVANSFYPGCQTPHR